MDRLTALALDAASGDPRALAEFVRAAQPDVWRFCASVAGSQAADDLTQDAIVRAIGALPRYRGEASARTWLLAVARHTVRDAQRRWSRRDAARARLRTEVARRVTDPAGRVALESLIASLDDDRRTAFVLTQVLGLTYAEAAVACDCPVGTVRSRVARARAALIDHLDEASAP
jgi:RNA polymerase sigma-70 factor (ECF subfamily)